VLRNMKMRNYLLALLTFFIGFQSMAQSVVTNRNGKEITVNSPASTSAQGQVQLAGDLGGTADAPTVPALSSKIDGTGTINFIPKFTGVKSLGNSLLFDNGTNIGVGTTSPGNKLEITQGTAGNSGLRFTNLNSSSAASTASTKVLGLNSNGDVILTNVPGTENIVAFSTATPTTSGVVFTPNTPADQSVVYQSAVDNSMWTYNGTTYVTYTPPASTAWFTAGTTNDAGNSKTSSIYRTGNVGININNPLNKLVVRGTDAASSALGTARTNATFRVDGNTNHALDMGTFSAPPYGSYIQSYNKASPSSLPLSLNSSGGNVGIGTVNPTSQLSNTAAQIIGSNSQSSSSATGFAWANTNIGWGGALWSDFQGFNVKVKNTSTIAFEVGSGITSQNDNSGAGGSTPLFKVMTSGNVGIGTAAPTTKLEINSGTTGTSGLKFTQLTAASTNTSTAVTSPIGVDANGVVVPLGSSRRVEPLALNATYDITVNTFGSYKVTVAGSDTGFRTFADEYIITIANSFARLSVQQIGGVYSAGTAQTMRTAYNVASATLSPVHGRYNITFNASGTSNVITTRALADLALITTKVQSLW
jgi:hypothetical protein